MDRRRPQALLGPRDRRQGPTLQVVGESAGLCGLGGMLGLLLGVAVAAGLNLLSPVPTAIAAGDLVRGLATALLVGVLAGLAPAWRAVRLDPIEVIRRAS